MTHQICTRITLNEERFYVDGALVIASSLRNTEIKRILSVWSLEAFLRLLGRFREMTRGPWPTRLVLNTGDRQNTLFNTKMQRHRHRRSPLDYMIFFSGYRMHHIQRIPTDLPVYDLSTTKRILRVCKSISQDQVLALSGNIVAVGKLRCNGAGHEDWEGDICTSRVGRCSKARR